MAIAVPGCPELACCTASMLSVRMVLTQSWSSCFVSTKSLQAAAEKCLGLWRVKSYAKVGLPSSIAGGKAQKELLLVSRAPELVCRRWGTVPNILNSGVKFCQKSVNFDGMRVAGGK